MLNVATMLSSTDELPQHKKHKRALNNVNFNIVTYSFITILC